MTNQYTPVPARKLQAPFRPSAEEIARACHEVNRAYCEALGDHSQLPWDEAPQNIKASAMDGVLLHLAKPDAGPQASHENWMTFKLADGWTFGEKKDAQAKTHPCIMPFEQLPREQQAKDFIFRAVVHALNVFRTTPQTIEERAKELYAAYGAQGGGVTFDGKPLPKWEMLGDDRRACWMAAAKV